MAYATGAELVLAYDANLIADQLADGHTVVEIEDVSTHAVVLDALERASGEIKSAMTQSNQYTASALDELVVSNDAYLRDLTIKLAMGRILARRGQQSEPYFEIEQARLRLEELRVGKKVLDVPGNKTAGVPDSSHLSSVQLNRRGFTSDNRNIFPPRRNAGS